MQDYVVTLQSAASKSFRCAKAANSLDIDVKKKLTHELRVRADIESDFNVGLIVGASGSGKTTLARQIWGDDFERSALDLARPVIDQFPEAWSYDDCARALSGVGLTQVVCWIRPAHTLSNGQRARAEIALRMAQDDGLIVVDEWTSVVDRNVARAMSHTVQKWARKTGRRIILLSCHYDVIEWLAPDWIVDCNRQQFECRRRLRRRPQESIAFDIRDVDKSTWGYFSKYHYLSDRLPGGGIFCFGVFRDEEQIGFQCFANYVPHRKGTKKIWHSNRTVIHPDYAGLGLGIKVIDETSKIVEARGDFRVMAKFSSEPIYRAMSKSPYWKLKNIDRPTKAQTGKINRGACLGKGSDGGFRTDVKVYSFEFRTAGWG